MRAIHSYKFDKYRTILESLGGPAIIKPLITIMALSAATIRRHHDDFVLITDDIGAKLARACNMPYSEIVSVGDEFGSHDCFWIHSKLYAYATMDRPFVHYDTDIFLWDPLPQEFLNNDLFNFHSEAFAWPTYEQRFERLLSAGIKLPNYEERYPANKSPINMAIFGGHDVDTINLYGSELLALMEDNDRFYDKSDAAVSAIETSIAYIEQALGSYIIQSKYEKKVTPLLKEHQVVSGQVVPGVKITHMHALKQVAQESENKGKGAIAHELQAKLDKKLKEVSSDVHSAMTEFTKSEVDIDTLIQEANSNDSNFTNQET